MDLNFSAHLAELIILELAFAFNVHVNFVPLCNIILAFTDGTN